MHRVEFDLLDLQLARLDLGKIEQVIDDVEQRLGGNPQRLGEAALFFRQLGIEQQVGHAEHAVHRRPDLVAHVGEELGLRTVRALGLILGRLQLGGSLRNLLLEVVAMFGQFAVARLDLRQHLVEAGHQFADFVLRAMRYAHVVTFLAGNFTRSRGQIENRRGHFAAQATREQIRQTERKQGTGSGERELTQQVAPHRRQIDSQHQIADRLVILGDAMADSDLAGELDVVQLQVVGCRRRSRSAGRVGIRIGGEQPAIGQRDPRRHDV